MYSSTHQGEKLNSLLTLTDCIIQRLVPIFDRNSLWRTASTINLHYHYSLQIPIEREMQINERWKNRNNNEKYPEQTSRTSDTYPRGG